MPIARLGVLAFFVHTSLVLMFSLERLAKNSSAIATRFYIRRAFRIYPLAIVCVLAVTLLRIAPIPNMTSQFEQPSRLVLVTNLLLVQNLIGKTYISSPLWSLPFEVQMYLVLPICFFLAIGRDSRKWILGLLLFFAFAGSAVSYLTGHANLLAYIPCFLSGVLAYTLRNRSPYRLSVVAWPIFLLLWFWAGAISFVDLPKNEIAVGWAACFCLGLSIYLFPDCKNRVWNSVTNKIAKYSYGIYLAHVPVIWLVFRVWGIADHVAASLLCLVVTAIIAVSAYHLIEAPMIEWGRRLTSTSGGTILAPTATLAPQAAAEEAAAQ